MALLMLLLHHATATMSYRMLLLQPMITSSTLAALVPLARPQILQEVPVIWFRPTLCDDPRHSGQPALQLDSPLRLASLGMSDSVRVH